jgi:putative ABC transport system ATP-binding protein
MISFEGIRKVFHSGTADARVALDGVSVSLPPGEFAVIIGGNGAGKSTLLNVVGGTVTPDSGHIRFDGADVTRQREEQRARLVARVFQDPMLGTAAELTVEENLTLAMLRPRRAGWRRALSRGRRDRLRDALARFGLGLEDRLTARAGLLSGGQRQALALAMATIDKPKVLLLDEHTAALDPRTSEIVMQATVDAVRDGGVTALMVTHNMQHALDHGSRILMMDRGRIQADIGAAEKKGLTVEALIARFKTADDKILLSG